MDGERVILLATTKLILLSTRQQDAGKPDMVSQGDYDDCFIITLDDTDSQPAEAVSAGPCFRH